MPLDATVGGPTANSYVTSAEAAALMGDNMYGTSWLDLDAEVQDQSLISATRLVDTLCYLGQKATQEQALKFPRTGLIYDGWPVPSDIIPHQIKVAVCEQAKLVVKSDPSAPLDAEAQGLKKVKAGSVEVEFKEDAKSVPVPSTVSSLIPASWQCETVVAVGGVIPKKAQFAVI